MNPMTPPLCPVCGRRASERRGWASRPGYKSKHVRVLGHCISPFHDAGDWGPKLFGAVDDFATELESRLPKDGSPYECGLQNQAQADAWRLRTIIAAAEGKEDGDD